MIQQQRKHNSKTYNTDKLQVTTKFPNNRKHNNQKQIQQYQVFQIQTRVQATYKRPQCHSNPTKIKDPFQVFNSRHNTTRNSGQSLPQRKNQPQQQKKMRFLAWHERSKRNRSKLSRKVRSEKVNAFIGMEAANVGSKGFGFEETGSDLREQVHI